MPCTALPCFCSVANGRSFGQQSCCCPAALGVGLTLTREPNHLPPPGREARHVSLRRPHHPAGDHRLAGTLYLPLSGPPAPAVVFVHGAGPAVRGDRYHELARHFARKGVAALIYDKRGCGESTGDWTRAGLPDLAEDALACVRLLAAGRRSTRTRSACGD